MDDEYENNFNDLLNELNSITHDNSDFNNLDSKYILRQRIIIINTFKGFDHFIKNKIIQQLMMLGNKSNNHQYHLLLEDIYVSFSKSNSINDDTNPNDLDQSDILYDPKHDYNIINDHQCTHFVTNLKIYNKEEDLWYSCKNCYLDNHPKKKISTKLFTHIKCDKCDHINKLNDLKDDKNIQTANDVVDDNKKSCQSCDKPFSEYQCHSCLIFENDEENYMYHCPYCKECKLGEGLGIDYNHCTECDCCMPLEMFHSEEVSHRCIKSNLSSDCTICGVRLNAYQSYERLVVDENNDDKESSNSASLQINAIDGDGQNEQRHDNLKSFQNNGVRKRPIIDIDIGRVQFLVPCNHAIHETCLNAYLKNGQYKCPICQVTIVDMEINFKLLDEEIQQCPLPEPYNLWRCVYKCNDCTTRGMTSYHFLGIKCRCCFSFNTVLLQVLKHAEEKANVNEQANANNTFIDTKRSIVSKEMVNESFMSRKRSNSEIKDNDMDDFLNKFLSNDEDLSISHVLQGLKQYYSIKKTAENDKKLRREVDGIALSETVDFNSMMYRLKFNVMDRFLSKKSNADTESDVVEANEDTSISEGDSRQKTLFNDIGDSLKQFISFLEDSNAHDM